MGFFSFFSCKNNKLNNVKLEEITSEIIPKDDFIDISLKIIDEIKTNISHIYIAKGIYQNKTVGLQIEINSDIPAGIVSGEFDTENGFVSNGVRFKSIGKESDELVKALSQLYNESTNKKFTNQIVSATVFSLNDKSVNLDNRDYYKLKLFFEENDENLYSEIYLNINTNNREVEIKEKDEAYRKPIIQLWTN